MANKQKQKKKFGLAGGKHAVKRMRPWTRDRWLQKRAAEGYYWYCCSICHKRFSNTADLIFHQHGCKKTKSPIATAGHENHMNSPPSDTAIVRDGGAKEKADGVEQLSDVHDIRISTAETNKATLFQNDQGAVLMGSVDGIMPISQDSSHNLDNGFDANYGDPSTHNETIESDALSRYSLTSTPLEDQAVFLRRSERKPKPTSKLNACSLPCIKDAPCKNNSSKKRKYEKQFLNGVKAVSLQDACCYESVRSSTATLQANIIGASEKDQNDGKGTVNEESNSHCLKEKTERDTRKRKSVQCTEEAASQRLYAITQDGCEYTYYILSRQSEPNKKDTNVTEYWETVSYRERLASYADNKSKTDTKSRTATRKSRNYTKREGVNDLKRSKAKRIKKVSDASMKADKYTYKLIRLEDHLDSYCIEDFTGSAPSVSRNPNEHEQSSRYLCKLCGSYRTLKREQLEQHIGYHMSGKLNCSQCNFIADSSHNLKSHKRAEHHADKALYLCEICGVGKSNSTTFKTHVSKVHGKAVYKCCKCNSQFHDDKEFREHRLNAHEASSAFKCDV